MANRRKYTKELLEPLVRESKSVAQILRRLGIPYSGGSHGHISRTIKMFGLDTSHFTGAAWNQGKKQPKRTAEEILVKGYKRRESAYMIRRALLQKGVSLCCIGCGIGPEYQSKPLILEIDHINNDWGDNTIENLQFLCPNCHSQKTTKDGSLEKYLKQVKSPVVIREIEDNDNPLPTVEYPYERGRQLKLNLTNWKTKKPRQSPPDVNWRKLPHLDKRKVEHPSKKQLEQIVWEKSILQIAKDYGVTDNAVRAWCRRAGVTNLPPLRYWPRRRSGWTHEEALEPILPKQPVKRFTDQQVKEILLLLKEGVLSQREIAEKYNINRPTISRIKTGKAYAHILR